MRIVALDGEAFYDKKDKYSLSHMAPTFYLTDPRFEPICFTATENGKDVGIAWGSDIGPFLKDLGLDRPDTITIAHNARFDGAYIAWKYGIYPNQIACTVIMMRLLGLARLMPATLASLAKFMQSMGINVPDKGTEISDMNGVRLADMDADLVNRFGLYARKDTFLLYMAVLLMHKHILPDQWRAMDMYLNMFIRAPFRMDKPLLEGFVAKMDATRQQELEASAIMYGVPSWEEFQSALRSKPKLAALLKAEGVEPPMKPSAAATERKRKNLQDPKWVAKMQANEELVQELIDRGITWEQWTAEPVMDYAFAKTDLEFLDLHKHPRLRVRELVKLRDKFNSSIMRSRTLTFIRYAECGAVPCALEMASAHTARAGGADSQNYQNLPSKPNDITLRKSLTVPPGHFMGGADSSQVEPRVLAYIAQETPLLEAFARKDDIYVGMAETVYHMPAKDIRFYAKQAKESLPPEELARPEIVEMMLKCGVMRDVGKVAMLSSGYQMGPPAFSNRLKLFNIHLHPEGEELETKLLAGLADPANAGLGREDIKEQICEEHHLYMSTVINKAYRSKHPAVVRLWKRCDWVLSQMVQGNSGYFGGPNDDMFYYTAEHKIFNRTVPGIRLPNGYWIIYPNLRREHNAETGYWEYKYELQKGPLTETHTVYGGKVVENITQATAYAILEWQGINIDRELKDASNGRIRVDLNVHDEWLSVFPKEWLEFVKYTYTKWMSQVPEWITGLPVECEWAHGENFGEC